MGLDIFALCEAHHPSVSDGNLSVLRGNLSQAERTSCIVSVLRTLRIAEHKQGWDSIYLALFPVREKKPLDGMSTSNIGIFPLRGAYESTL